MHPPDLITVDPEILGGTPVFRGTRVPVKTLFDYLEDNYCLDEFIECFPSVPRELACRVIERSEAALLTASTTLVLESPVFTQPETLQVELTPAARRGDAKQLVKFLDSLPPGTMTKEEIDHEIEDVRGDWS